MTALNEADRIYLAGLEARAVYVGADKAWEPGEPPEPSGRPRVVSRLGQVASLGVTTDTVQLTLLAPPAVGNSIVVAVKGTQQAVVTAITDPADNPYQLDMAQFVAAAPCALWHGTVERPLQAGDVITVRYNLAAPNQAASALEVSGRLAADRTAGAQIGAAGQPLTVGPTPPVRDDVLSIAALGFGNQLPAGTTIEGEPGWTIYPPIGANYVIGLAGRDHDPGDEAIITWLMTTTPATRTGVLVAYAAA